MAPVGSGKVGRYSRKKKEGRSTERTDKKPSQWQSSRWTEQWS